MTVRDRLIELINKTLSKAICNDELTEYCSEIVSDAILNSRLFCKPEDLQEQVPHVYRWTAVEDDGYTHSEAGVANNMLDAFIKATEYSPSYHKKIVIEKMSDEELTEDEKQFKELQ